MINFKKEDVKYVDVVGGNIHIVFKDNCIMNGVDISVDNSISLLAITEDLKQKLNLILHTDLSHDGISHLVYVVNEWRRFNIWRLS